MAFYSDFAGHYETVFPFRPKTFEFLDKWLPNEGRVLDVGCGTGAYCARLASEGRHTLGIDLDPGMITEAERLYPSDRFQILGMEEVGLLPSEGFSGVICIGNVLSHLPTGRLAAFIMDIHKLLAPGGIWVFQT
ncbi:MAG: 2-polyprenyl-3-methyl-5-hydroxy-6-metoxy-1,4-benzoquinol methylase, partial [Candidatus Krumholzibacteriia bacterium]